MGEQSAEREGPDLTDGVLFDQLHDGVPLLGHLNGEAVMVVRRGDDAFAVGATCTHYGGPLAKGVVEGDTVRCPWHHACFSLRSGEALAAPALNPIARWEVTISDGVAWLGEKRESGPLAPLGRHAEEPSSVVIVGGGAAGSAAAEMLRRQGYTGPVVLVDDDDAAPYDRPNLSKDYLAGSAPEEWIPLRPPGFYAEHEIERISEKAIAVDTQQRIVTLATGATLPYGALLLATGATPIRLPIPGADRAHVHVLRSLDQCREIIAAAKDGTRVVILGASFIGMEVAASLRSRELEVTVVAPESVPFERTLGRELGEFLMRLHEQKGVRFRLGQTASEIGEQRVRLADGSEVDAELVVVGVGVRPNLGLAEAAGLRLQEGVVVDEYLETSAKGVFAAGDIARFPYGGAEEPIRVEHWVVAQRQAQAAAKNMLGQRIPFSDVPFFWTQHYDVPVAYVGHAQKWDRIELEGDLEAQDCAVRYLNEGKLLALATIGRDQESLAVEAELRRRVSSAMSEGMTRTKSEG